MKIERFNNVAIGRGTPLEAGLAFFLRLAGGVTGIAICFLLELKFFSSRDLCRVGCFFSGLLGSFSRSFCDQFLGFALLLGYLGGFALGMALGFLGHCRRLPGLDFRVIGARPRLKLLEDGLAGLSLCGDSIHETGALAASLQ